MNFSRGKISFRKKDQGRTTDPALALETFKPNLYDLTILDIRMPKINGFELYHQLKSRDSNMKTLFISALSYLTANKTHNSNVIL